MWRGSLTRALERPNITPHAPFQWLERQAACPISPGAGPRRSLLHLGLLRSRHPGVQGGVPQPPPRMQLLDRRSLPQRALCSMATRWGGLGQSGDTREGRRRSP